MGLQVRVKHSLGTRLIELPDRTIDNPITVGRAAGVEVQVPSVSVAQRHCVLFRYEGHWAVQDVQAAAGTGTSGTFVNGQQVIDPAILQIGDVISVGTGASAPTIEVDPAAAAEGRTGWAGAEMTAAPAVPGYAAPGYASPAAYSAPRGYGAPSAGGYVSTGGYAAPHAPAAPAQPGWGQEHAGDAGDHVDLAAAAATTSYRPSYRRRKPQTSSAAIVIGVLVSVAVIGGAAWLIKVRMTPEVVEAPPPPVKPKAESGHANNIFGIGGSTTPDRSNEINTSRPPAGHNPGTAPDSTGSATAATPADAGSTGSKPDAGAPPVTPPATKPVQVASAGTPGTGEEMTPATPKPAPVAVSGPPASGDEWQEMLDLYNTPGDPALAIFRFTDFQKRHPGQHADELQKYLDSKFDRLWWDRLEQLFKKQDRLRSDIDKKQNEIFDETDKDMKKKEQEELAKLKSDLNTAKESITSRMAYAGDQPPPSGAAELASLREKRDNAKYTEWKRTTLISIVNNKGKTDWEGDN